MKKIILPFLIFCFAAAEAQAYIGPGIGLGTMGVVLGIFLSAIMALIAIVWYPVKRLFGIKRKKKRKK